MYTKEQKERALKEFERLGSVQAVVTLLGYPSRHTLYEWYRKKIADITDYHGSLDKEYIIKQKYINKLVLEHDSKIDLILCKLNTNEEINHIFYEGQIYDAYSLLIDILSKAKKEIIIIYNQTKIY